MRKEKILLLLAFFVFGIVVFAQPSGRQMEIPTNGLITGKVLDDKGTPVEYASVSLISMRDSSIISGAVTDVQGAFKMAELRLGVYKMKIKGLGFETKEIGPIFLMPKGRGKGEGIEQKFDDIKLGNSDIKIDDVTVVGSKSNVQYKLDKKVVNVSQDINSSSGSAVEVLQNIPAVNVDIDGNVTLRGSGNFTVLIDGKPTTLTGSEALQQIPANLIENIEIITNPSAKFDPDGAAGIINVIMKKKLSQGINGVVNASIGTNDKYKGNVALNYKSGKIGVNASIDYRNEMRYGKGSQANEFYDIDPLTNLVDTTHFVNYSGKRNMKMKGFGFQGGIDYYINGNNTLSVSGRYFHRDFGFIQDAYYHEWYKPTILDSYYLNHNESGFGGDMYNVSLDYNLKLKKPEQKLSSTFTYSHREGVRKSDQSIYLTDAYNNITDLNPVLINTHTTGPENDYRYKIDYSSPVGESGTYEAGYQMRYEKEDENFIYSHLNSSTNIWEVDTVKSNNVNFLNNIQALYSTYANKILGFDYKIGVRAEYNYRFLDQLTTGENFKYNKFDLFPSAYITRQLNKSLQAQLNYSRRINRPDGRELDPFIDYSDPKNLRQGNPKLDPEYVNSYELNFQQQFNKSFVSVESFYRRTNNKITSLSSDEGNGVKKQSYANLNYDNSLGFEVNANIFLAQWWKLNVSGSGFYYQLKGDTSTKSSFNYNFRFDNSFILKSGTKIQINGFYNGPSVTLQGNSEALYFVNFAIRQDFLKNKLTLTAQIQDIFGTTGMHYTESTQTFYSKVNMTREPRVVTFSLTYRLNNYKQKRNSDRSEENENEIEM